LGQYYLLLLPEIIMLFFSENDPLNCTDKMHLIGAVQL